MGLDVSANLIVGFPVDGITFWNTKELDKQTCNIRQEEKSIATGKAHETTNMKAVFCEVCGSKLKPVIVATPTREFVKLCKKLYPCDEPEDVYEEWKDAYDLFKDFFGQDYNHAIRKSTEGFPVTDMFRDENGNQVIEMALAGFAKENLEVEVKDNSITISCKVEKTEGDESHRRIAKRAFSKTFVDYENRLDLAAADVKFNNGLLSVTLPEDKEKEKPRLLKIK